MPSGYATTFSRDATKKFYNIIRTFFLNYSRWGIFTFYVACEQKSRRHSCSSGYAIIRCRSALIHGVVLYWTAFIKHGYALYTHGVWSKTNRTIRLKAYVRCKVATVRVGVLAVQFIRFVVVKIGKCLGQVTKLAIQHHRKHHNQIHCWIFNFLAYRNFCKEIWAHIEVRGMKC
jgi:hypothetical protein